MAISIVLEASELLEHFQWKNKEETEKVTMERREEIEDEIADIFVYLLELSDNLGIDLVEAAGKKVNKNEAKYLINKSKGSSKKYTEL
mgnify:CR=1 FL=1